MKDTFPSTDSLNSQFGDPLGEVLRDLLETPVAAVGEFGVQDARTLDRTLVFGGRGHLVHQQEQDEEAFLQGDLTHLCQQAAAAAVEIDFGHLVGAQMIGGDLFMLLVA